MSERLGSYSFEDNIRLNPYDSHRLGKIFASDCNRAILEFKDVMSGHNYDVISSNLAIMIFALREQIDNFLHELREDGNEITDPLSIEYDSNPKGSIERERAFYKMIKNSGVVFDVLESYIYQSENDFETTLSERLKIACEVYET